MYIYIDESTFMIENKEYHGVGLFITETKIQREIIEMALENLKKDPDIKEANTSYIDMQTLNRRYFHSTDDSKNAHSHLCRSISGNINGIFNYSYTKPSNDNKSLEEIYRLDTQLVSLIITDFNKPINIYIEQRTGLTQIVAERLIEDLYNMIDQSAYSHPILSAYYPKINLITVDKDNPGIQVVDFMLWSVNNNYSCNKKGIWLKRLGLKYLHSYDQVEGVMAGGSYKLNTGIESESTIPINLYPDKIFPLTDEYYNQVDFEILYLIAEQYLHYLNNTGLPPQADHFKEELIRITDILRENQTISNETMIKVAKLFIRLFDTVPIYSNLNKNQDIKEFELLLHVRRCMGLVLNGEIYGIPAITIFKEIRNSYYKEQRDLLFAKPELNKWLT